MINKLTIVDFRGGGDGVIALYIEGKLHKYGDYYHDKIEEWIEGFINGVTYLFGEERVLVNRIDLHINHPLVEEISELAGSPPDKLSEIRKFN